jgi:hypothetical protein
MRTTCEGGVYLAPAPGVRSKEDTAADPVLGVGARSHADSAPALAAALRDCVRRRDPLRPRPDRLRPLLACRMRTPGPLRPRLDLPRRPRRRQGGGH